MIATKIPRCGTSKNTQGLSQKIQAIYFKIQGTYFKIYGLYFWQFVTNGKTDAYKYAKNEYEIAPNSMFPGLFPVCIYPQSPN